MSFQFRKSLLNKKRFIFFAAILIALTASLQAFAECAPRKAETGWIAQTLRVWKKTRQSALLLPAEKLPWMVLFDESCVWHINPDLRILKTDAKSRIPFDRKVADVYLLNHAGKIALPNAQEIPARLLSFASGYDGGKKSFFVAAMPSIWQKAPNLQTEKNLDALVKSVFMHELTHTLHRNFYARLDEIEKRLVGVENFNDDLIQNTFQTNDEFRKAFENEHKLLYEAVGETNLTRKRELAKQALALINARRQKFFTEKDALYAEIEEIFLTMEGAANWTAYQAAIGQGLAEPDALKLIRRSGKYWSQDEGLAMFLIIDALLPKWQKKAFGKSPATVTDLLSEAVR